MIRGLILDKDYENGKNIKMIVENTNSSIKMDILDQRKSDFCLIDATEYDFIISSVRPVMADVMLKKTIPFTRLVLDKRTDYIEFDRSKERLLVDRNHIVGIEVMEKDCFIYSVDEVTKVSRVTMGELIEKLEIPEIVRCHKSYAVNVKYVKGFIRETRKRWKINFAIETEFDAHVTDLYFDNVVKKCEKYHGVKLVKTIRY